MWHQSSSFLINPAHCKYMGQLLTGQNYVSRSVEFTSAVINFRTVDHCCRFLVQVPATSVNFTSALLLYVCSCCLMENALLRVFGWRSLFHVCFMRLFSKQRWLGLETDEFEKVGRHAMCRIWTSSFRFSLKRQSPVVVTVIVNDTSPLNSFSLVEVVLSVLSFKSTHFIKFSSEFLKF